MALREEFVSYGNWMFKYRSYIPLLFMVLVFAAIPNSKYPGDAYVYHQVWTLFTFLISLFGLGLRIVTVGHTPPSTSGRNTKRQVAQSLNSTGIYSAARHPLYLANFIIWIGVALYVYNWWVPVLMIFIFWLYYERIMFAEEQFLREKFGETFEEWASQTPAFIPSLKNWRASDRPFSWRKAIKREYTTFFSIVLVFTILELATQFAITGTLLLPIHWKIIFIVGLLIYLILRVAIKKTALLNTNQ